MEIELERTGRTGTRKVYNLYWDSLAREVYYWITPRHQEDEVLRENIDVDRIHGELSDGVRFRVPLRLLTGSGK